MAFLGMALRCSASRDEAPDGLICTLGPPICRARHLYRTECQSLLDCRQLACNVPARHLVQLAEEVGRLDQVIGDARCVFAPQPGFGRRQGNVWDVRKPMRRAGIASVLVSAS
jgi:hypothetical protein